MQSYQKEGIGTWTV